MLASIPLRKACFYENVGFPYLVESVAPSQVGVLLCMNNMTSHQLPNHSIGLTFERISVFPTLLRASYAQASRGIAIVKLPIGFSRPFDRAYH